MTRLEQSDAVAADPLLRYVPRLLGDWPVHTGESSWRTLDCTLAFLDISGFTTLSERLAHHGKIGAEALKDLLNMVFGAMMDRGYDWGGSLIKFGGDALLMLFVGEDHVRRGCSAAVEMRAALRQHANTPTVAGRARLRVSIGVHTGVLDVFRVGQTHQELLVAGPMATKIAQTESAAHPGEIVVSDEVMRLLPPDSTRDRSGIGHTLRWRRPRGVPGGFAPRSVVGGESIVHAVALGLREHLAAGVPEPEHRTANVAFVKVEGVDDLLASGGHERVAGELQSLICTTQQIVADEGVVVLSSDIVEGGVKLILTAGVPYIRPDDEGRMLRAVRRIVEIPTVFSIKIGVQRGHMFAGDIGSAHRGSFTIVGDPVNVGARLMGLAGPGTVLADPSSLERSSTQFAVEGPFELTLKGRRDAALAYSVGPAIGQRARTEARLPFVGRAEEIDFLRDVVTRRRGAVTIKGDTGIGKTRLVDELLSEAGLAVLEARGEPHTSGSLFGSFMPALRELLGIGDGDGQRLSEIVAAASPADVEMIPLLADVLGIAVPMTEAAAAIQPRFRTARAADALGRVLEGLEHRPEVLWFDDLHWMDGASLELATRLAAGERPWASLLTARTQFDVPAVAGAERLDVPPLENASVLELIDHLTAHSPLRPYVVTQIIERADGNPFYINEVVSLARSGADLDGLPESLDATVSAQLDRLNPEDRRLARFASVLGKTFDLDVLEDVLRAVDVALQPGVLDEGPLAGIFELVGAGRVGYRHAIVRRVAYEALSYGRRSQLHRVAARVLTKRATDPTSLASLLSIHHFEGEEPHLAWKYSLIAGDGARDRYANNEAAELYRRALAAAEHVDQLETDQIFDVWVSLGDVQEQAGRFEDSREAYRRAERLPVTASHKAHARYRRARAEMRAGRYVSALRSITGGLHLTADDTSDAAAVERAQLTSLRSSVRMAQWKPEAALRAARVALQQAELAGDLDSQSRAHLVIHWASLMLGHPDGLDHGATALELSQGLGDLDGVAHAANNLGGEAYFSGRWDDALEWYREAERSFLRAGNDVGAAVTQSNIGEVLVGQRRCGEALDMLRGAVRVLAASANANDTMFAEVQLARGLAGTGQTETAVELLNQVFETASETGQAFGQMEAAGHLALILSDAGRIGEAHAVLDRYAQAGGEPLAPTTLARVDAMTHAASGDLGEAERAIARGLAAARQGVVLYDEAQMIELADGLGLHVDPAERSRAADIFGGLGVVV